MSLLSLEIGTDVVVTYRVPYWQQTALPILRGPLCGSRWLPASGGKLVRLFWGTYESAQTRLFQQHVTKGSVVFDLGANVGYYSLLSAKLVGQGQVVAFEPEPRNLAFLRANIAANHCHNVLIRELAVAAENGVAKFQRGSGTGTGSLTLDGPLTVKTVRLDDFVAHEGLVPTHLKIDVEGAEFEVLQGALETLVAARPTVFLSTHGPKVHADCCDLLRDLHYELRPIEGPDVESAESLLCLG